MSKQYHVNQSPLYKLRSKKKLYILLGTTEKQFHELLKNSNYKVFSTGSRLIQTPRHKLKNIHRKINNYLTRVALPTYLHSGRKKHSPVSNAKAHIQSKEAIAVDIRRYFPSTKYPAVFKLFNDYFKCSPDVSGILARLCTYKGMIPTGSPLSMSLAFWANRELFGALEQHAKTNHLSMTLYVDDLVFSGEKIPSGFQAEVLNKIREHGLTPHLGKLKFYSEGQPKQITGVIISEGEMRVKNKLLKDIYDLRKQLKTLKPDDQAKIAQSLTGKLSAAAQIDPRFKRKIEAFQRRLNS